MHELLLLRLKFPFGQESLRIKVRQRAELGHQVHSLSAADRSARGGRPLVRAAFETPKN